MNAVKKAWNWSPPREALKTVKARALRGMVAFLALMVCCTLVARTADTITVPVVETATSRRMGLTHEFSAQGMLEIMGGQPVMVHAGLPVLEVPVAKGDRVEEGDLLFTCDISQIQQEIKAKNLDAAGIQAEMKVLEQNKAQAAQQGALDQKRAEEDLKTATDMADLKVREATLKVKDAKTALEKYDGVRRSEYEYYDDYTVEEYEALHAAYRIALLALEEAEASRDNTIREAERKVTDQGKEASEDSTMELKRLSLQKIWLELAELNEIAASGGAVYAPMSGAIRDLAVKAGGVTTGEAAALITDSQTLQYSAKITAEQKKEIAPGDLFTLELNGKKDKLKEIPVRSIEADPEEADTFLVKAELPADIGEPGLGGTATFSRKSQTYDATIPLSALYGSENDYYVLGVRTSESILGTEYVAERMDVRLLERDDSNAAVSGIGGDTMVITGSGKTVRPGDRIRMAS